MEWIRIASSRAQLYGPGFCHGFFLMGQGPKVVRLAIAIIFWETSIVGACFGPTTDKETIRFFGFLVVCLRVCVCLRFNFP